MGCKESNQTNKQIREELAHYEILCGKVERWYRSTLGKFVLICVQMFFMLFCESLVSFCKFMYDTPYIFNPVIILISYSCVDPCNT